VAPLSDKNFSIDDILNEHPNKDGHSATDGFDLDALLSSKSTDRAEIEKELSQKPKDDKKKKSKASIASEIDDLKDEPEVPKKAKKKSQDGETEILLGQKKLSTIEIDMKSSQKSNAFEAVESFEDSRTGKLPKLKKEKKKKKLFKKQIEEDDIPVQRTNKKSAKTEEHPEKLSFEDKPIRPLQHTISGNTELIDSLIRIKHERIARTSLIQPISRKSISDIDLNLDDKILPNTEQIPIEKTAEELEKLRELNKRRQKKVEEFVLVGDEEESDEDELKEEEENDIADFEGFGDAPSVMHDIRQLKGTLAGRFVFLLFTSLVSIYITLANDFRLPVPEIINMRSQPLTYLFILSILGLLSVFVSYTVISCGIAKLFKLQADCDSLSALAVVSSITSAMLCLASPSLVQQGEVNIFITPAIVSLLFNTIGKILIVSRTEKNFRYVSGDFERYAIFTIDDEEKAAQFTRGTMSDFPVLAAMRKTEFISDFLKNSYAPDITDKFCKIAAPVIFAASLLLGVLTWLLNKNISMASSIYLSAATFAGCISLCSCFAAILVVNLPMRGAAKKALENSSAIISYQSTEEFADTNSVLVDVAQLFPHGMINLSAIKIFSDTRIDEAIVEAASLTSHAGSILKYMFYDIIAGKTEMLNPVESYIYEDSLGLCGWINNKRVLLGNRELMINHSIGGLPTKEREKEYTENGKSAIYLSISGELSAMFVVELKASLEVQKWLKELEKNEVYVILRSVDSIVSINRLSEMFDISPDMLKIIPFRLHKTFDEITSYTPKQSTTLACAGRFASFASLIIAAKKLRKNAAVGICVQAACAIAGLLIALALTAFSTFNQLTGSIALAYNLAWAALTVLLQAFKRP
jgi:Cu+-exporting ATPase